MEHEAFVDRVLQRLSSSPPTAFSFQSWKHAGRPTEEGFGIMPIAGVDPEKVAGAVMDLDHYVGNVEHVSECRIIADDRFSPPASARFYQRVDIPLLGAVQHELALHDLGEKGGYRVLAWHVLRGETDALDAKKGFRSDYNHGAWFAAPGVLGYALGSAPKRDDVGFLKWKALTRGADAAASRVLKANIEGMAAWAARR
ncbi:MAG: hypothetical protein EP330_01475 [Deltaproteobacteria bacterium]|nr:MAG: hypothetical protein EP330_01475 [Deltaproteobacteria bacterium]